MQIYAMQLLIQDSLHIICNYLCIITKLMSYNCFRSGNVSEDASVYAAAKCFI